jgi:uncharacterized hydrophobic protein (TIGR00271 family)
MEDELDHFDNVHEVIVKDIVFKGTNLWILMFAIIVASVGLNMNSTAVIIGAMLISPLMGPINGMGYSIATYNLALFRQSVKNFTFAVLASLFASTTYFALSPVSTAHSELLARTTPTIYDVLIALFGGMAGIVATTSRQKGNVIPGVAIATALMPPLCTAGYGLATAQFNFFFGAFYLFTINTVFIALASVAISQILKFPIRTLVDTAQKKKVNRYITLVILIVLLPSIYFGYLLVQKEKFNENAKRYIHGISSVEGNFLLKSEINPSDKTITLVYGGVSLNEEQKQRIIREAEFHSLPKTGIQISQGLALDIHDKKITEATSLREELNRIYSVLKLRELQIDSIRLKDHIGKNLLDEISILVPQITGCTYAESTRFPDTTSNADRTPIVIFSTGDNKLNHSEKEKVGKWVESRLNSGNVRIFYE